MGIIPTQEYEINNGNYVPTREKWITETGNRNYSYEGVLENRTNEQIMFTQTDGPHQAHMIGHNINAYRHPLGNVNYNPLLHTSLY